MALSGSVTTSSSSGRSVTLNWSATQSIANNTSTVSWTLVGSGSASGWVRVSELRVTINGTQVYYRDSSNHTDCYSGTQLASGSTTISHNSDGTKSFKSITVYAYSKPAVSSFTAARSTSDATKMIVKANWTFASVNSKNSATGTLYYKLSTSNSWTTYGTISKNTTTTLTGTFAEDHSYDFRVIVKDAVGNSAQKDVFVSTIEVLLDFRAGGKGLGIGKIAETDSMEVALASNFYAKMSSEYSDIGFYASKLNMENIQKPITVAREDFIAELTFMINESGLPPIILEPIFKDMLRDISAVLQKQVAADRKNYEEAVSKQQAEETAE